VFWRISLWFRVNSDRGMLHVNIVNRRAKVRVA
jgi:hypothetical protein